MAKMLIAFALVGSGALAFDDASVLLQVSKGDTQDPGEIHLNIPSFKDVKNHLQDKYRPTKAAARRAKEEMDVFDNRKEVNAKVMENNRKQRETLQKVYAQQDQSQSLHFKKEQEKINKVAAEKFKSSVSNEQIEKMQETSDKLTQILNSTEAMPEDAMMMVLGMTKNGDPNVMGLYQQMTDHAKQYGTNTTFKLLGPTQRSKEGWMMAEAGMFGEDEQKAAVEHKKEVQAEEAEHKALKDQAAVDYATAKAAQAPPAIQQTQRLAQQLQQQWPKMQAPAWGFPQQAAPQPAAWGFPQPAAYGWPAAPQANPWAQAFPQQQAYPQQKAAPASKTEAAGVKADADEDSDENEKHRYEMMGGGTDSD